MCGYGCECEFALHLAQSNCLIICIRFKSISYRICIGIIAFPHFGFIRISFSRFLPLSTAVSLHTHIHIHIHTYTRMFNEWKRNWRKIERAGTTADTTTTNFMYANVPNDEHLNDENTVHMVDKVHADKEFLQHSWKRMHHPMTMVAPLDCSHPCRDSVFSISCGDFGTKF